MKTQTTTRKNAKNKSNLGFKKGMLGSLFQREKQTLRKEKARKRKRKKPKILMFSKKGLMAKKQRDKMEFRKGRQKQKKQNRKKRNTLRQAFCGNKIDKKPLKLQENSLFGPFFSKHKNQNTGNKKQNHQKAKKKNIPKKTFLHFGKQPLFLVNFCFCSSCILSCLQSCVC